MKWVDSVLLILLLVLLYIVSQKKLGCKSHCPSDGLHINERRVLTPKEQRDLLNNYYAMKRDQPDITPSDLAAAADVKKLENIIVENSTEKVNTAEAHFQSDMLTGTYEVDKDGISSSVFSRGYGERLSVLVLDQDTVDRHKKWTEENLIGGTGGLRTVDNLNEALEAGINFKGLQRPLGVTQLNPLFITERDPDTLSGNKKIRY